MDKARTETVTIKRSHFIAGIAALTFLAGTLFGGIVLGGHLPSLGGGSGGLTPTGASTDGTGAQPQAVQVSADDDFSEGSSDAKITVIEFTDMQCPFCRRFWSQTYPALKTAYIQTGKVRWVYRDFPLSFHPTAIPAAVATECAAEQGKFLEVRDKIFEEQNKQGIGTIQFTTDDIKAWAATVPGIDTSRLNNCIDSGTYLTEVQKDFNDGAAAGVSGTPTFFVGAANIGWQRIVGAQPTEAFKAALDAALSAAG